MDKSWHLMTPHLRSLSRAIQSPRAVDRSGKPMYSHDGTLIRNEYGMVVKQKRKRILVAE